jgi:hypothetical protein
MTSATGRNPVMPTGLPLIFCALGPPNSTPITMKAVTPYSVVYVFYRSHLQDKIAN